MKEITTSDIVGITNKIMLSPGVLVEDELREKLADRFTGILANVTYHLMLSWKDKRRQ